MEMVRRLVVSVGNYFSFTTSQSTIPHVPRIASNKGNHVSVSTGEQEVLGKHGYRRPR